MKTFTLVLNVALLTAVGVSGRRIAGREEDDEDSAAPTPWIPFFGSFPSFSFLRPNRVPAAPEIKATKTEYVQVTRRMTVHPVCYTMYQNRGPCLQQRYDDDSAPEMDVNVEHHISLPSEDVYPMNEMARPVKEALSDDREGKYLYFGKRPVAQHEQLETSEDEKSSEHYDATTTVRLTRLEKYTDRRVTATVLAVNCMPVDPAIKECPHRPGNPIVEVPLYGLKKPGNGNAILITPVKPKSESEEEEEIERTVEAVKKLAEAVRAQPEDGSGNADEANEA